MGKYIKKFDTHSDYEDFIETEDFIRPNVSYCVDNKDVHYNSTQTLFAVEFESGKFAFGHADEDELFVATKDGLAQIWYTDANGVITGNTPSADNVASAIIDGYNEHFGTDIQIWTPETKTLQVGDTVPNWNAYEKIEMLPQKITIDMGKDVWIIGDFLNGLYRNWTNPGESTGISANEDGIVMGNQGLPDYVGAAYFNQFLTKIGLEATSVENYYISMEIGSTVPDWENFTKILE